MQLGAQDLYPADQGAHTGDVSPGMLVDCGCSHVLVGHSERRSTHGESDALVAHKFENALSRGLTPVLCVGETLEEREAGGTAAVVLRQFNAVLGLCGSAPFERAGTGL